MFSQLIEVCFSICLVIKTLFLTKRRRFTSYWSSIHGQYFTTPPRKRPQKWPKNPTWEFFEKILTLYWIVMFFPFKQVTWELIGGFYVNILCFSIILSIFRPWGVTIVGNSAFLGRIKHPRKWYQKPPPGSFLRKFRLCTMLQSFSHSYKLLDNLLDVFMQIFYVLAPFWAFFGPEEPH